MRGTFLFSYLLAWPDELPSLDGDGLTQLDKAAILLRSRHFLEAESLVLSGLARSPGDLAKSWRWLHVFSCLCQRRFEAAQLSFDSLDVDLSLPNDRFLQLQIWIEAGQHQCFETVSSDWWDGESSFPLLAVSHLSVLLATGNLSGADQLLSLYPADLCVEWVCLRSRLDALRGNFAGAALLLDQAAQRFPAHLGLSSETVRRQIDARSRDRTIPCMRNALNIHGEQPELLESAATLKLLQREPAQARRCHLMLNAFDSVRAIPHSSAGLINAYEQTGFVSWMPFLHRALSSQAVESSVVKHNLCMFLPSFDAKFAEVHIRDHVHALLNSPDFSRFALSSPPPSPIIPLGCGEKLTIAWLTGDLVHHPVSRFLLGFFQASVGRLAHRHVLVNLKDHQSESVAERFSSISGLEYLDVGPLDPAGKLAQIRAAAPHVAIDLSGWTDGNFAAGFLARLAPVQVNYLGFFASTGIPAMDAWLGDAHLFPDPMDEWHEEQVVRLQRCFIAWEPRDPLPEARMPVTQPPVAQGIRFGSFNHNRKLSDSTLRLWGQILEAIPGSRLVLKANHRGDEATQILLRRRMQRQGLDVNKVIWLPIAPTPEEHLQQYSQMDVALDCFPNGGCTTTCEALWMGVPVITLTGATYVSRMSTAVLHGAGLSRFCADTEARYVELAHEQASNLQWLRQNRFYWRRMLQSNPLGDAADLMAHLEKCFSSLYASRCNDASASCL